MLDILIRGNSRERNRIPHPAVVAVAAVVLLVLPPPLARLVETLWADPPIPSDDGPLPDVSPYHLHLYRDSTVILLPCLFAHLRATPRIPLSSPVRQGINGNSDFFEASFILANRPRRFIGRIYTSRILSSTSRPSPLPLFSSRILNESVQFRSSVRDACSKRRYGENFEKVETRFAKSGAFPRDRIDLIETILANDRSTRRSFQG